MFRTVVAILKYISIELSSRLGKVQGTLINKGTCKTGNWLGAGASWAVVTKRAPVLITIAKKIAKTSCVTVVTSEAWLAIINTTLVVDGLESTLRAPGRLLTSNWAVSTRWAALRDPAIIITVFTRLAHCAF